MDTILVPIVILAASGLALLLLSAAEGAAIQLARRRISHEDAAVLSALLREYVSERQGLLRALHAGILAATAAAALAGVALVTGALRVDAAVTVAAIALGAGVLLGIGRRASRADAEAAARRLDPTIRVLSAFLAPVAFACALPAALLFRALGRPDPADEIDPAEELIGLMEATDEEDAAMLDERRMIRAVLELSGRTARELMTPRPDVTALPVDATFQDAMRVAAASGFSRIPLYEETLDHVVGVVYAKDLLAYLASGATMPRLVDVARPPYAVPETRRADELLTDLRRARVHLAIVVDEYGGTAGVITVEDLVEEIVGEITDEYDVPAEEVEEVTEDEAVVDGGLAIDELNRRFSAEIVADDFDTVGGLIVTSLGRLAVPGDEVVVRALGEEGEDDDVPHLRLRVLTIVGRRIRRVRVERLAAGSSAPAVPPSTEETGQAPH